MKRFKLILRQIESIGTLFSYIYPYKVSVKLNYIKNRLYTGWIKRFFYEFSGYAEYPIIISSPQCISIGKNTIIKKRARICANTHFGDMKYSPVIKIGNNCSIGSDCFLSAINRISVGNNVAITARTLVLDNVHGDFREKDFTYNQNPNIPDVFLQNVKTRKLHSDGPIIIEDDVHIGENCVILSGVTIGHNSVISANSVVTKNVPPYSIVSGNPGRVLVTFGKKSG